MNIFVTRPLSRIFLYFAVSPALISALVPIVVAQSVQPVTLTKIYVDAKSGRVHIVDSSAKDFEISPDKDQADAAQPKLADDHRTAGWLIESKVDDGTSYPIPLCLVIHRDAKIIRRFPTDMAIGDWQFVVGAKQVAFSTSTLHGDHPAHLELHDIASGELLAQYDQVPGSHSPDWAKGIENH